MKKSRIANERAADVLRLLARALLLAAVCATSAPPSTACADEAQVILATSWMTAQDAELRRLIERAKRDGREVTHEEAERYSVPGEHPYRYVSVMVAPGRLDRELQLRRCCYDPTSRDCKDRVVDAAPTREEFTSRLYRSGRLVWAFSNEHETTTVRAQPLPEILHRDRTRSGIIPSVPVPSDVLLFGPFDAPPSRVQLSLSDVSHTVSDCDPVLAEYSIPVGLW